MACGTMRWSSPTKRYGFIQPQGGGKDVFVHISAVERAGLSTLNEGQQIEYEIEEDRGKTSAVNSRSTRVSGDRCGGAIGRPRWSARTRRNLWTDRVRSHWPCRLRDRGRSHLVARIWQPTSPDVVSPPDRQFGGVREVREVRESSPYSVVVALPALPALPAEPPHSFGLTSHRLRGRPPVLVVVSRSQPLLTRLSSSCWVCSASKHLAQSLAADLLARHLGFGVRLDPPEDPASIGVAFAQRRSVAGQHVRAARNIHAKAG